MVNHDYPTIKSRTNALFDAALAERTTTVNQQQPPPSMRKFITNTNVGGSSADAMWKKDLSDRIVALAKRVTALEGLAERLGRAEKAIQEIQQFLEAEDVGYNDKEEEYDGDYEDDFVVNDDDPEYQTDDYEEIDTDQMNAADDPDDDPDIEVAQPPRKRARNNADPPKLQLKKKLKALVQETSSSTTSSEGTA